MGLMHIMHVVKVQLKALLFKVFKPCFAECRCNVYKLAPKYQKSKADILNSENLHSTDEPERLFTEDD